MKHNQQQANQPQPAAAQMDPESLVRYALLSSQQKRLMSERRHKEAIPVGEELLALLEKVEGPRGLRVAGAHNNLGISYHGVGDAPKSERHYLAAISIHEEKVGKNAAELVPNLSGICSLYTDMGDFGRAESTCKRAIAIAEKEPSAADSLVYGLNNLGEVYKRKGDALGAERLFRRALDLHRAAGRADSIPFAETTKNLADALVMRGQFAAAQTEYETALKTFEQKLGASHYLVAVALDGLAEAIRRQAVNTPGQPGEALFARAEQARVRSVEVFQAALGPTHPYTLAAINNLAHLLESMGRAQEAEKLMRDLVEKSRAAFGPEHPEYVKQLNNVAVLTSRAGRYKEAIPLFEQNAELTSRVFGQQSTQLAVVLHNLAITLRQAGDMPRAIATQTRADAIDDAELVRVLAAGSEQARRAFASTLNGQFFVTVSMHADAAPSNPAAARMAATAVLRRKGRLLDASADVMARLRSNLGPRERELLDKLRTAHTLLASARASGSGADIKAVEGVVRRLEEQISAASDEFRRETSPVTLSDVQQRLPEGAALVEYLFRFSHDPSQSKADQEFNIGAPRYIAYVIRKSGDPNAVDLGPSQQIDAAVRAMREAMASPQGPDPRALGRKLDALVMEPVRKVLGDEKLLFISPDGQLNLAPFGALVDEKDRYLVKSYAFDYLASGRDLLRPAAASKGGRPVVIANPDFDARSAAAEGARSRGVDLSKVSFPALPGTGEEGAAIARLLSDSKILSGRDASKSALLGIKSPSVLHVATHGFFLGGEGGAGIRARGLELDSTAAPVESGPVDPLLRSGLVLAGANLHGQGTADDGVVTALEVSDMDLRGTRLVVLSACETGIGDIELGDGVYGLRRALAVAGAETQVMSLWKVDDEATRDLMVSYYRKLQSGVGRAEAMRQVQSEMLDSPGRARPYYWAAFMVSGRWTPLEEHEEGMSPHEPSRLPTGLIFLPRIGGIVSGGATASTECTGSGSYSCSADATHGDRKFDALGSAAFALDILIAPTRGFRFGVGTQFVPSTKFEKDGVGLDAGKDLTVVGIIEPVIPLGSRTGLAVRGQGGFLMLFPGGDLDAMASDAKDQCYGFRLSGASCSVDKGPYKGWTAGGGIGLLQVVGKTRLRGDISYQFLKTSTVSQKVSSGEGSGESTVALQASRFVLTAGLEF